jgi:HAD superfamily hydrolase (TIGR01509 family)
MLAIKGIGFDLFGTLVLQERFRFEQCIDALHESLVVSGFHTEKERFVTTYREVNRRLMAQATAEGRETHNCLWVAGALQGLGYSVAPEDACIEVAVEAYFEPFIESCHLIPGTRQMLESLVGHYRVALLSNFTHPPAVERILARVGIEHFFTGILISGRIGHRKPHPAVFAELRKCLGLTPSEIAFVGDELQTDILGAREAGMQTVWMTYRQRLERPPPLGQFLGVAEHRGGIQPDHEVADWSEFLAALA